MSLVAEPDRRLPYDPSLELCRLDREERRNE